MAELQTAASHFKCRLQGTEEEWDGLDLEYEKSNYLRAVIFWKTVLQMMNTCRDSEFILTQWVLGFDMHLNLSKILFLPEKSWHPQSGIWV